MSHVLLTLVLLCTSCGTGIAGEGPCPNNGVVYTVESGEYRLSEEFAHYPPDTVMIVDSNASTVTLRYSDTDGAMVAEEWAFAE